MAARKQFGPADYTHYDKFTVSLTHPDAVIALSSGRADITAHFASPPFHQRERKLAGIKTIMTSNEVMGGPSTFIRGMREAWQQNIPKTWEERKVQLPEGAKPEL